MKTAHDQAIEIRKLALNYTVRPEKKLPLLLEKEKRWQRASKQFCPLHS